MSSASWLIELPEGRHEIRADYGYWSAKATIRVDGRIVSTTRHMMAMSTDFGVDVPIDVDGHAVVVAIRMLTTAKVITTGYTFGLSIDGMPAPGATPVPPISPGANPIATYFPSKGPPLVERLVWASAVGATIGLSQRWTDPIALLYVAAPLTCSLLARHSTLSTRWLAVVCATIMVVVWVVVAYLSVRYA